jgi:hypothetical protein
VSYQAIAAALALDDLSTGERLAAFSLASFADRENRARPGTPAAAARAGLVRSGYLEARVRLERRGLVAVEQAASGRGRASTLWLAFAVEGPWWDGDINAELFEAVLGYSRARGSERLLIAAIAALANDEGVVEGVTTELLCTAAGISDRTYRRAHRPLLTSGELVLRSGTGGRGNTNRWEIPDPRRHADGSPPAAPRRVAPSAGVRPLVTSVIPAVDPEVAMPVHDDGAVVLDGGVEGGQDRTVSAQNGPDLSGVWLENRPELSGVSEKGCQVRTVSSETPAKTPAKTPAGSAPYARAGREPQNPRTIHPPRPPQGGTGSGSVLIEEVCVTDRGRKRRRTVRVDLDDVRRRLVRPTAGDRADWRRVRDELLNAVGESTYAIWLEALELIAVDKAGVLVVSAPAQTRSWLAVRFWRLIAACAEVVGRQLRLADEPEAKAMTATTAVVSTTNQKEAS